MRETHSRSGFTLIEIIVVVSIIAIVFSLALPNLSQVTNQKLNSTVRKFSGIIKSVRNDAILLGVIHRLVLDLDNQRWWVEAQRNLDLIGGAPPTPKKGKKKEDEPPPSFLIADKYGAKPLSVPSGIAFDGVLKENEGEKREGIVYIHFFPSGFSEASILYLRRQSSKEVGYSLYVQRATGKVEVFREKVTRF